MSFGGWLTLILGAIVLYGGLFLCLRIAVKGGRDPRSERESDGKRPIDSNHTR